MPVDGVHPHANAVHQPSGRGSDATKAEDSADPAREHAVLRELIELATFEVFVLRDQALGGGKCHGERVLSHRLGIAGKLLRDGLIEEVSAAASLPAWRR